MKLLIITQTIDSEDSALGFFHRWVEEFARQAERVEVVCLYEGSHDLPSNVRVHSLGKESGRAGRLQYILAFYKHIIRLRRSYDAVFVHMNPEYVLLGSFLWRILGKPITLWYTHGTVAPKLRIAVRLADRVFTASERSMRIETSKRVVIGHGIDIGRFSPNGAQMQRERRGVITIGRISRVKRLDLSIEAMAALYSRGIDTSFTIVGAPITKEDRAYERELRELAQEKGVAAQAKFLGPMRHDRIPEILSGAAVFLHTSETGSVDKVVIEALAMDVPVVTTSGIFKDILSVTDATPESVATAIQNAFTNPPKDGPAKAARYALPNVVCKILDTIDSLCAE